MDLKELRQEERRQETEKRKKIMVDAAFECFSNRSIEAVSIADIAKKAGFGEATIYRYFSTKENLALECGIFFWARVGAFFQEKTMEEGFFWKTGMEQVEVLMRGALDFFKEETKAFRLIHNLDGFLLSHQVEQENLKAYEQAVLGLQPYLYNALERGKADGSIGRKEDVLELYYALTNGVFGMMQKQAAAGNLLASDGAVTAFEKTALLTELLISGLKA